MSAAELVHASPLALAENAWGRRRYSRRSRSTLQRLVTAYFLLAGAFELLGSLAFAWKGRWFTGMNPLAPWVQLSEGLLMIALGISLLRGSSPSVRAFVATLLFAKAAASATAMLGTGAFASPPWFAISMMLLWASVGVGVWRAAEWGRRSCMIVGLAMHGYLLACSVTAMRMFVDDRPWIVVSTVTFVMLVCPYVLLAIYGVLPSTRKHFADVRAAAIRS